MVVVEFSRRKEAAMVKRQASGEVTALTETELELMNIIWDLGGGGVNDVLAQLPENRKLAYTSVSTILRILQQKGVLRAEKHGRSHRYIPIIDRQDYQKNSLKHIVKEVFQGSPAGIVRHLVEGGDLSANEIEEIKSLLKQ